MTTPKFIAWPKIGLLHNVRRRITDDDEREYFPERTITYRAKVKLHGTNAAIHVTPDGLVAQSRNRLLTPEDDNHGFAKWVATIDPELFKDIPPCIIYGEWCGKGIQQGVALSQLPRKVFAIFAVVRINSPFVFYFPEVIQDMVGSLEKHEDIFVLDWYRPKSQFSTIVMAFDDPLAVSKVAEYINKQVDLVEACDPWSLQNFDVSGVGEGLVYYPIHTNTAMTMGRLGNHMFKAKGKKHSATKTKVSAVVDPEKLNNALAFADMFVTNNRLEQAVQEVGCQKFDTRQMGDFLKWVGQDIKDEGQDELDASGLKWKDVSKVVTTRAREWFFKKAMVAS